MPAITPGYVKNMIRRSLREIVDPKQILDIPLRDGLSSEKARQRQVNNGHQISIRRVDKSFNAGA